ncbi:MAG TPA: M23 family metallopeptidase [Clostridiales bacterium]|nr:M23 family metallopeptidase [Clostridiales bacterium]
MENVAVKPRYPRNNAYYRRRRAYTRDKSKLSETIAKQLVISIMIFLIIWLIKGINTSVTNFISSKVGWTLSYDTDLKDVPNRISNYFDRIINGHLWEGDLYNKSNENAETGEKEPVNQNEAQNYESDIKDASEESNQTDGSTDLMNIELITPVKGFVSSYFGERIDPITQKSRFHYGLDIEADKGAEIKAAADGEVLEISEDRMYGRNIKIKHPGGIITVYAHCSKITRVDGEKVRQGDIIAEVGDTGYSTGTHLHFEIWKNGKVLDPLSFIDVPLDMTE